ncbi:MAG: SDR family oxidoreductase [Halobacteriales archaeon]|nr:SDR family oxidoreductase [Halobacteriales archaeon]
MTTFVTGFPGFLGSALVDRLVAEAPEAAELTCLVQPRYRRLAEDRAEEIEAAHGAAGAIELVGGDIVEPDLGLGDRYDGLQAETTEAYHLAAVYDLGVDRTLATRVNVDGTRHVLEFLEGAPSFDRLHYVSTCYVSGRYDGRFGPDDLLVGQTFNNHYEATKFQAEVAVRHAMARGLPATVYRPGIVVGDSETGATRKYDGPYQVIRLLLRQPGVAVAPLVGDPTATELNVVPRDHVIDAIDVLRRRPEAVGETYQLANPAPPTVDEFVRDLSQVLDKRVVRIRLPRWLLKGALEATPGLARATGVQPALIDYFDLPTRYDASKTVEALAEADVSCPPLSSYLGTLVDYVRANPEAAGGPMT